MCLSPLGTDLDTMNPDNLLDAQLKLSTVPVVSEEDLKCLGKVLERCAAQMSLEGVLTMLVQAHSLERKYMATSLTKCAQSITALQAIADATAKSTDVISELEKSRCQRRKVVPARVTWLPVAPLIREITWLSYQPPFGY